VRLQGQPWDFAPPPRVGLLTTRVVSFGSSGRVLIFEDDDAGYRDWLWSNLSGYVVNAQRGSNPGEPILHRATCDTITPTPDREWTKDYIKIR